jgi:hypothetical protein
MPGPYTRSLVVQLNSSRLVPDPAYKALVSLEQKRKRLLGALPDADRHEVPPRALPC